MRQNHSGDATLCPIPCQPIVSLTILCANVKPARVQASSGADTQIVTILLLFKMKFSHIWNVVSQPHEGIPGNSGNTSSNPHDQNISCQPTNAVTAVKKNRRPSQNAASGPLSQFWSLQPISIRYKAFRRMEKLSDSTAFRDAIFSMPSAPMESILTNKKEKTSRNNNPE